MNITTMFRHQVRSEHSDWKKLHFLLSKVQSYKDKEYLISFELINYANNQLDRKSFISALRLSEVAILLIKLHLNSSLSQDSSTRNTLNMHLRALCICLVAQLGLRDCTSFKLSFESFYQLSLVEVCRIMNKSNLSLELLLKTLLLNEFKEKELQLNDVRNLRNINLVLNQWIWIESNSNVMEVSNQVPDMEKYTEVFRLAHKYQTKLSQIIPIY